MLTRVWPQRPRQELEAVAVVAQGIDSPTKRDVPTSLIRYLPHTPCRFYTGCRLSLTVRRFATETHHAIAFQSRETRRPAPPSGSVARHTAVWAPSSTKRVAFAPPISVLTQPGHNANFTNSAPEVIAHSSLKLAGTPEDIAGAVKFLAFDAPCVSGADLCSGRWAECEYLTHHATSKALVQRAWDALAAPPAVVAPKPANPTM